MEISQYTMYGWNDIHPSDGKNEHLVFVYGSLKQGYGNYQHFLGKSEFIGDGVTQSAEYDMVSLGMFPGVVKDGRSAILGELYRVNRHTFQSLDQLEGNGSMYLREQVKIIDMEGQSHVAWIYIYLSSRYRSWDHTGQDGVSCYDSEEGFDIHCWETDRWNADSLLETDEFDAKASGDEVNGEDDTDVFLLEVDEFGRMIHMENSDEIEEDFEDEIEEDEIEEDEIEEDDNEAQEEALFQRWLEESSKRNF